jgi:hypothetical protein
MSLWKHKCVCYVSIPWFEEKKNTTRFSKQYGIFHSTIHVILLSCYMYTLVFNPVIFDWSACTKPGKIAVLYMGVRDVEFVFFYVYDLSSWTLNCFYSVTVWYFFVFHFISIMINSPVVNLSHVSLGQI